MSRKTPIDRQHELKERFQLPADHYFFTRPRDKEAEESVDNELNALNKSGSQYMMGGSSYRKAIRTFEGVLERVYAGAPVTDYNLTYALYGLTYSYSHWLNNVEDEKEWDIALKKLIEYSHLALCYMPTDTFFFTDTAAFHREVYRIAGNAYAWWTMMLDGDLEEALAAVELAVINVESDDHNFILDTKVRILLKMGRTDEAYRIVIRVLDKHPHFGDFQDFLENEDFLTWYEEVRGELPTYGQKEDSEDEDDDDEDDDEDEIDEDEVGEEESDDEPSYIPQQRHNKLWPEGTVVATVKSDVVYEHIASGGYFGGFADLETELYDKLVANGRALVVEGDVHVMGDLLMDMYSYDYNTIVVKGSLTVDGTLQLSCYYNPNFFVLGNLKARNILFGHNEMWVDGDIVADELLVNSGIIRATGTINAACYYENPETAAYLEAADEPLSLTTDDFSKKLVRKGKVEIDELMKFVIAGKPYLKE